MDFNALFNIILDINNILAIILALFFAFYIIKTGASFASFLITVIIGYLLGHLFICLGCFFITLSICLGIALLYSLFTGSFGSAKQ